MQRGERDVNATKEKGIRHVCATSNTEMFRILSRGAPMRSTTLSGAYDVAFGCRSCPDMAALFRTSPPTVPESSLKAAMRGGPPRGGRGGGGRGGRGGPPHPQQAPVQGNDANALSATLQQIDGQQFPTVHARSIQR
jgi:hypothetical protein